MSDLVRQLADLGAHLDAVHPTPEVAVILGEAERRRLHPDGEVTWPLGEFVPLRLLETRLPREPRRRWLAAAAAAAVVLVLIGGIGLLARIFRAEPDVTDTTTVTTSPPTTVIDGEPGTFVGAGEWQLVSGFAGTDWLHGVASTEFGLLAWGIEHPTPELPQGSGTVWYSSDGMSWSEVLRAPGAWFGDVVATPQGLIAVGFSPCESAACTLAPTIWASTDGTAWELAQRFEEPDPGRLCCGFSAIETLGSRLVALAGGVEYTSGGGVITACGGGPCTAGAWTSDDGGTTWSRHPFIDGQAQLSDLVAAGPGLVAVGATRTGNEERTPAVWYSVDGETWTVVEHPGGSPEMRGLITAVTAGGPGLVAVGQSDEGWPSVWTSADGIAWSAVSPVESVSGWLGDVVALPSGSVVAVGQNCDPAEVRSQCGAGVWNSPDGVSWVRAPYQGSVFLGGGSGGAQMGEVAAGPLGVIAVGFSEVDNAAAAWFSTPTSITPTTVPSPTTTQAPSAPTGDAVSAEEVGVVIPVAGAPTVMAYGEGSVWVSNRRGGAGVVSRLDATGNEVAIIELGEAPRPDSIAAADGAVWVGVEYLAEAGRIDPVTNSFSGEWVEVGFPATVAVGGGHAWVLGYGQDDPTYVVSQLDVATGEIVTEVSVDQGGFPFGIVAAGNTVWAGVDSDEPILYQIDPSSGEVVSMLEIFPAYPMVDYDGGDTYIAFDGEALWVTGGHMVEGGGLLLRIDPETAEIVESIRLDMRPTTMAVGEGRVWVLGWVDEGQKEVHVIDASTNTVTGGPIVFEQLPSDIAVGGGALWISHADAGTVTRIDLAELP